MHIKRITLSGFKSYKDTLTIDNLSSLHNTIVGRNGSGKSNFFTAIQFVLGEKGFDHLSHKERQEMLHEGAGSNVMTAFVEIVFENSDGRLPIDSEEVVLRRTIGLKKDEYFLNQKHVSKSDVVNLLESAGFSRSNPYYIVKQGKVNALCTMKARERLDLIKEVAGTTVYEERKKQSREIMEETEKKRENIEEAITYIEDRLKDLQKEQEELLEFRKLDRERRALEFVLFDKDLVKVGKQLDDIEKSRSRETDLIHQTSIELDQVTEELRNKERDMKLKEQIVSQARRDIEVADERKAVVVGLFTKADLKLKDLEEQAAMREKRVEILTRELNALEKDIERQNELQKKARPDYDRKKQIHNEIVARLREKLKRQKELVEKQGRSGRFSSLEERNTWLRDEIKKMEKALSTQKIALKESEEVTQKKESEFKELKNTFKQNEEDRKTHSDALAQAKAEEQNLKKERETMIARRKEAWRMEQETLNRRKVLEGNYDNALKLLKATMPFSVASGLDTVDQLAIDLNLESKIYGPLFRLIESIHPIFNTAIEVAAQNQLLHVVVEDDATAALLMTQLQDRKAGRVTFKPLNRMNPRKPRGIFAEYLKNLESGQKDASTTTSTSDITAEAHLLISKLRFDEKFDSAVRMALDNVLLCKDHDIAARFSRQFDVNCVTLEGDEVNRRGALTGGYHDVRKSRLALALEMKQAKRELETCVVLDEAKTVDSMITKLSGDIEKVHNKQEHLRSVLNQLIKERDRMEIETTELEEKTSEFRTALEQNERGVQEIENQFKNLRTELQTSREETLSTNEQDELRRIREELEVLHREEVGAKEESEAARVIVVTLESDLRNNLMRKKRELEADLERNGGGGGSTSTSEASQEARNQRDPFADELEEARSEYNVQDHAMEETRQRQEELSRVLFEKRKELGSLQDETEQLRTKEAELSDQLEKARQRIEVLMSKRTLLLQRREAATQKIRELGSLPGNELDNFRGLRSSELTERIKNVADELKTYSHVNKKALDQYMSFTDQREALLERKAEIDAAAASIEDLITHLDLQKDEAILRTFRGVSRNFRQVFSELVPNGKAELRLLTREKNVSGRTPHGGGGGGGGGGGDSEDEARSEASDASSGSSRSRKGSIRVDQFIGLSPRVSFTKTDKVTQMQRLSGGQKALVALTLIFAIQRCDPAPFYLFDEIDQALDETHREAVAKLIQNQQTRVDALNAAHEIPAQFITVTFRPELVRVCEKCYGIQFQNKVSSIVQLGRKEALEFVGKIVAEEEKVHQTAAAATDDDETTRTPRGLAQQEATEHGSGDDDDDDDGQGGVLFTPATGASSRTRPSDTTASRKSTATSASSKSSGGVWRKRSREEER